MDAREQRGMELAKVVRIDRKGEDVWLVPSMSGNGRDRHTYPMYPPSRMIRVIRVDPRPTRFHMPSGAKRHASAAPIAMAATAEALGECKFTRMQVLALAAFRDEPSTAVGPRFGVSASAIRHRCRRALAKLTPAQREHYRASLNRPRNRTRVRPASVHKLTEGAAAV